MPRPPAGSAFTRGGPDRADHLRDDEAALDALIADNPAQVEKAKVNAKLAGQPAGVEK